MKKLLVIILFLNIFFNVNINAKENFFKEAKNKFDENELIESKFLFQRNIVFNPKDSKSYLFLAKIHKLEKNEKKEIKNLKTAILLDPENEEALFMLIDIEIKKSNFSVVNNLIKDFEIICFNLCKEMTKINKRLKNIDTKNETKQ
ncbi:hypothetical protein OAJ75_00935 [Candidatus Pelagibacter sp.]|nr:hypothetical protein [Candidatus Pelagibacter sp.]